MLYAIIVVTNTLFLYIIYCEQQLQLKWKEIENIFGVVHGALQQIQ